jgi:hypothetical protein
LVLLIISSKVSVLLVLINILEYSGFNLAKKMNLIQQQHSTIHDKSSIGGLTDRIIQMNSNNNIKVTPNKLYAKIQPSAYLNKKIA